MAKQDVMRLLSEIESDQTLQEKFTGISNMEELLTRASESGFQFSEDELRSGSAEYYEANGQELSDEQLESVSGGTYTVLTVLTITIPK